MQSRRLTQLFHCIPNFEIASPLVGEICCISIKHLVMMESETENLFAIHLVSLVLVVTALFLNVTGAILLWKIERGNTNQKTILLNLSICHATNSFVLVAVFSLSVSGLTTENRCVQIVDSVAFLCFIQNYFIMMIMSIDRFIGTKYPLRSIDIFSERRLKICLVLTWSLCVIIGILSSIFYDVVGSIFESIAFPVLDILSLCCIGITYGYIMYAVSTRKLATSATARRNTESRQLMRMTAIIATTFILLIVLPDLVIAFAAMDMSMEMHGILCCCFYVGLIADPITYLLIRQRLRKSFFNMFRCCCRRYHVEHRQSNTTNHSHSHDPAVIASKL